MNERGRPQAGLFKRPGLLSCWSRKGPGFSLETLTRTVHGDRVPASISVIPSQKGPWR